jgi:hypothetical protein
VAACDGNKILPSDFRPKLGHKFIGSSISSGSGYTCEPLLMDYQ